MEVDTQHPVSQCTVEEEEYTEISQVAKTCYKSFKVDNITVVAPQLLKVYYWQRLDIDGLNDKLSSDCSFVEHFCEIPTRQLNSRPLKIVFWFKSLCDEPFTMNLKRIQNCPCVPLQTRVGFNQFRYLYHCPHRRLIHILQDQFVMKPGDVVAMTMVTYYFMLGEYTLSYELKIGDTCILLLHFNLNIVTFDPHKAILTRELIPVRIGEHRHLCQVIWIRNITLQTLQFFFTTKTRGFHLINAHLTVPRQSVWPLIVEYMPNDFEDKLELFWTFGEDECTEEGCNILYRYKVVLNGKGYIDTPLDQVEYNVPLLDYECSDFLYIVYPNKLVFEMEINDERTLMVAVHNFSQNCMDFHWQMYTLMEYFSISFEPEVFTLKPHHKKLCVVRMKTFAKPLHFKRIPAILEIHRILDKSTQIAQQLLTEVESIDDPKWRESSYFEHVLLHIDLKVKFPKLNRINTEEEMLKLPACPAAVPLKSLQTYDATTKTKATTTIFEKLFWEHLSVTSHMRKNCQIPRNLTYEQVLKRDYPIKLLDADSQIVNKLGALNVLSFLTAEACRDLSKNHAFIPLDL